LRGDGYPPAVKSYLRTLSTPLIDYMAKNSNSHSLALQKIKVTHHQWP
jgi:hypothetical protein